jgi:hypothetical protein
MVGTLFFGSASAEDMDGLMVYASATGVLSIVRNKSGYLIFATTGGHPNGAATGADCTIKSQLAGGPENLVGELLPIDTDIVEYESDDVEDRYVSVTFKQGAINVNGVDVSGICGVGVGFEGSYESVPNSDPEYKESYFKLLRGAYPDSLAIYKRDGIEPAIESMLPYIKALDFSWFKDKWMADILGAFVRDYALFLERDGQLSVAIELLEKLISAAPNSDTARLRLGDVYWNSNQIGQAKDAYQQYLSLIRSKGRLSSASKRVEACLNEK